jgi:hypothetical protein
LVTWLVWTSSLSLFQTFSLSGCECIYEQIPFHNISIIYSCFATNL